MCEGVRQEYDLESLPALLQGEGVDGVSRLRITHAFVGQTTCTLTYSGDAARIDVVDARVVGPAPFRGTITRPLWTLRRFGPLASWEQLRAAAFAARSCFTLTCDGVGYRHAVLDWQGGTEAHWSNPSRSAHRQQCELVEAYQALIESLGLVLEQGSRVRIRRGLMAGFIGRVEQLERYEGRLRVVAELGGKPVLQDLGVSDIEFSPETAIEHFDALVLSQGTSCSICCHKTLAHVAHNVANPGQNSRFSPGNPGFSCSGNRLTGSRSRRCVNRPRGGALQLVSLTGPQHN